MLFAHKLIGLGITLLLPVQSMRRRLAQNAEDLIKLLGPRVFNNMVTTTDKHLKDQDRDAFPDIDLGVLFRDPYQSLGFPDNVLWKKAWGQYVYEATDFHKKHWYKMHDDRKDELIEKFPAIHRALGWIGIQYIQWAVDDYVYNNRTQLGDYHGGEKEEVERLCKETAAHRQLRLFMEPRAFYQKGDQTKKLEFQEELEFRYSDDLTYMIARYECPSGSVKPVVIYADLGRPGVTSMKVKAMTFTAWEKPKRDYFHRKKPRKWTGYKYDGNDGCWISRSGSGSTFAIQYESFMRQYSVYNAARNEYKFEQIFSDDLGPYMTKYRCHENDKCVAVRAEMGNPVNVWVIPMKDYTNSQNPDWGKPLFDGDHGRWLSPMRSRLAKLTFEPRQ